MEGSNVNTENGTEQQPDDFKDKIAAAVREYEAGKQGTARERYLKLTLVQGILEEAGGVLYDLIQSAQSDITKEREKKS